MDSSQDSPSRGLRGDKTGRRVPLNLLIIVVVDDVQINRELLGRPGNLPFTASSPLSHSPIHYQTDFSLNCQAGHMTRCKSK